MTLGQRAVACKRWRWLPGMRFTSPDVDGGARIVGYVAGHFGKVFARAVDDHDAEVEPVCFDGDASRDWYSSCVPDLTDHATLGCVLALVREAWSDPSAHTRYSRSRGLWEVSLFHALYRESGRPTEAEALIAALEAAPETT